MPLTKSSPKKKSKTTQDILIGIQESLKNLEKEVDMTQKLIHVEVASNSLRIEQELKEKIKQLENITLSRFDSILKDSLARACL